MESSPVAEAEAMIAAFNRGDIEAVLRWAHPECAIVALRSEIEGEYLGHDGVRRWAQNLFDAVDGLRITAEAHPLDAERVLLLGRQSGTVRTGGVSYDEPFAAVARIESGLLTRMRMFSTHDEAIAAAGPNDHPE